MRDIGRFFGGLFSSEEAKKRKEVERMNQEGEDMMNQYQRNSTSDRGEYLRLKEEIGFNGEILNVKTTVLSRDLGEFEFNAEENGHKIFGKWEYYREGGGQFYESKYLLLPKEGGKIIIEIDGKELSPEAMKMYAKRIQGVLHSYRMLEISQELGKQSIDADALKYKTRIKEKEYYRLQLQERQKKEDEEKRKGLEELAEILGKPLD